MGVERQSNRSPIVDVTVALVIYLNLVKYKPVVFVMYRPYFGFSASLVPHHVFRRISKIIKTGTTDECVSDMQCHLRLQKLLAVIITHCYFVFSIKQHFCLWSLLVVPFIRLFFRERKPVTRASTSINTAQIKLHPRNLLPNFGENFVKS